MKSFNVEFPLPIGTYVSKEEDGVVHVDQVYQYIIDTNGIFVVIMLDTLTSPRLSTPIQLDAFINNWDELKQLDDIEEFIKR